MAIRVSFYRGHRRPAVSRKRVRSMAVVAGALLGLFALLTAGCGHAPASRPTASATAASLATVSYPAYVDLRPGRSPSLLYREYRFTGSYAIDDFCDAVTVLVERMPGSPGVPVQRVCLMSNATGRLRVVVPKTVCGQLGWVITTAHCSSRAIAWEELSPGDDLIETVSWRLYAALFDPKTLRLRGTTLVAQGRTDTCMRPLFDVAGNDVIWRTQRRDAGTERGEVRMMDLTTKETRLLATTREAYHTVSAVDGGWLVTERVGRNTPRVTLAVRDFDGRLLQAVDLANRTPLVHFPAFRDGWLAWSLEGEEESGTELLLYLREPGGTVHMVDAAEGSEPFFCGDYLFFLTSHGDRLTPARLAVDGVYLPTLRLFMLVESTSNEEDPGWQGLFGAPTATSHLVLARAVPERDGDLVREVTRVRVYQVR